MCRWHEMPSFSRACAARSPPSPPSPPPLIIASLSLSFPPPELLTLALRHAILWLLSSCHFACYYCFFLPSYLFHFCFFILVIIIISFFIFIFLHVSLCFFFYMFFLFK